MASVIIDNGQNSEGWVAQELRLGMTAYGVVAWGLDCGCGKSTQNEGDNTLRRTLNGYIGHPNFAGVLLISLGCEAMQVSSVLRESSPPLQTSRL